LKNDRRRLDRAALAVYLVNRNRAEILNEQIRIDPVRPSTPAVRHSSNCMLLFKQSLFVNTTAAATPGVTFVPKT
jgi:hypothetical protein